MFFSKRTLCIILALTVTAITAFAAASNSISPSIDIIKEKIELKKCSSLASEVYFSKEDFDKTLCDNVQFVTFVNLPSESEGVLTLDGVRIIENQTVARVSLDEIKFTPGEDAKETVCFDFFETTAENQVVATCKVNVLSEVNLAPNTGEQTVSTQENIAAFKFLLAADPEGDKMEFEIVSYPKNGYVSVPDSEGFFEYVPQKDFVGKDSFEYTATDEYGNISEIRKVYLQVEKAKTDVRFDDMKTHWGHNSAVKMTATGLMGPVDNSEGKVCFEPDSDMTRGDFLAIALIMAGKEDEIPYVEKTSFEDDDAIPTNIKSYAQYAYEKNIVTGYENISKDGYNFASTDSITRSEAAVIVDRILSLPESDYGMDFVDASAIPDWASSSVASLYECKILTGTGAGLMPESNMTKAQAAEMMCNVAQFLEDKEKQESQQKKGIFNLFGLIG